MTSPPSSPTPAPTRIACSFCGQDNDPAAQFCGDCGKPLARSAAFSPVSGLAASTVPVADSGPDAANAVKCRKCGRGTDPAGTFCAFCGTRIADKIEDGSCPGCGGSYVKGSDLFCARCGYRVGERVSLVTR